MMISPESFADEYRNRKYKTLLKVRDELLDEIRDFEEGKTREEDWWICPSPSVIYQCNLLYLAELSKLIVEKYREERDAE